MEREMTRKIVLENGQVFYGSPFGAKVETLCELVFNTAMVGYQEIASDLSYGGQMIVMTYPLIGNYGITDEDFESQYPGFGGFVVREYNRIPSNFRYTKTLDEILEENGIPGVSGVDTRRLTRMLRDQGSMAALVTDRDTPHEQCMNRLAAYTPPTDLVRRMSCKKLWYHRTTNPRFNVVAVDCGMRLSLARQLGARRCNVTVAPYNSTPEDVLALRPDGILLTNGPGDPRDVPEVAQLVQGLAGRIPIAATGLGMQAVALAYGGSTYKMKVGHRGANHPVKDLATGNIEIPGQNHGYAVDSQSLSGTGLQVTHINLLDETVEGISCPRDKVYAVQYHPETTPGPRNSVNFLDSFINLMAGGEGRA